MILSLHFLFPFYIRFCTKLFLSWLEVDGKFYRKAGKKCPLFVRKAGINPFSTNPTKWSNTLKQFVGNLLMNCLSVFDHFWDWCLRVRYEKYEIR